MKEVKMSEVDGIWELIFGIGVFVAFAMLLYFLHKEFSLKRPFSMARRDTKAILNFSVPVYLSGLMTTFQGNIQTILLGALDTITTVGIFSVASRISRSWEPARKIFAPRSRGLLRR